jgi:hypothetical protein
VKQWLPFLVIDRRDTFWVLAAPPLWATTLAQIVAVALVPVPCLVAAPFLLIRTVRTR